MHPFCLRYRSANRRARVSAVGTVRSLADRLSIASRQRRDWDDGNRYAHANSLPFGGSQI